MKKKILKINSILLVGCLLVGGYISYLRTQYSARSVQHSKDKKKVSYYIPLDYFIPDISIVAC